MWLAADDDNDDTDDATQRVNKHYNIFGTSTCASSRDNDCNDIAENSRVRARTRFKTVESRLDVPP